MSRRLLLAALLVLACSGSRPSNASRHQGWPLDASRTKIAVDDGVSVSMPQVNGWPHSAVLVLKPLGAGGPLSWQLPISSEERHARDAFCWQAPPEARDSWIFDARCDWAQASPLRTIFVGVRRSGVRTDSPDDLELQAALKLLGDTAVENLSRLSKPSCHGYQYRTTFETDLVQRRICWVSERVIVLSATSAPGDDFPEADVAFDSLEFGR